MVDGSGHERRLAVSRLPGIVSYSAVWNWQRALATARRHGAMGDLLLLLEHEHVYTNGWRGDRSNLLADDRELAELGASYVKLERGGDITYHGPGQLVGYPIYDIRSAGLGVRAYIQRLETVIVQTLKQFGLDAETHAGKIGVWVGRAKIAAIGVKVTRGVAYHGFALNVAPDLSYFDHIIPCGINDAEVTSMARLLERPIAVEDVMCECASAFAEVFDRELDWIPWTELPERQCVAAIEPAVGAST